MIYTATYSPEDNKLRLYSSTRLDAETFDATEAAAIAHRWVDGLKLGHA